MIPVMRVRDENGNVKDVVAVAVPTMPALHAQKHGVGGSDPITLEMIGASDAKTHQLSTYTSLDQIGLSGEVTMVQVCEAMPLRSMLVISCNKAQSTIFVSDVPHNYGTITVIRAEMNYCEATYMKSNEGDVEYYVGKYHTVDGWTGWKKVADTDYAVNKAGDTMTGNLTVEGNTWCRYYVKNKATEDRAFLGITTGGDSVYMEKEANSKTGGKRVALWACADLGLKKAFRGYFDEKYYDLLHTGNLEAMGVPQIAVGSYTGNGLTGDANPNSLTFNFVPKFVLIKGNEESTNVLTTQGFLLFTPFGMSTTYLYGGGIGVFGDSVAVWAKFVDTTLYWYGKNAFQCNASGVVYSYIAIG